ncbi:MAG TPA: serine hydrolase domain-containing protein [Polyangiaceae bacterium]|nr:serine hydrolase domain-containing protein [Polyangiaceae bacterium]
MTADEIARRLMQDAVAPDVAAGCSVVRTLERSESSEETPERGRGREETQSETGGRTDLLFDLASVTKPMTAVAVLRAGIDPSTPLASLLPEARGTATADVPLELLLAHRAGLDAHRSLYLPLVRGEAVDVDAALREAADARRRDAVGSAPADGFPPVYSDLGYMLAGAALARVVGAIDAGEAIGRLVIEPLGLSAVLGTVRDLGARGVAGPFAPTEDVSWRGGLVSGAVHDENAWALTGRGGSGHAGLFGTVGAVLAFGRAVLSAARGEGSWLTRADVAWLVRPRPGGTLFAGFDGKSEEGSSAGRLLGASSFGHLGFTGTSLWIDPEAGIVVTVLTNRVCPSRDHLAIRAARPWAHDRLWRRAREIG